MAQYQSKDTLDGDKKHERDVDFRLPKPKKLKKDILQSEISKELIDHFPHLWDIRHNLETTFPGQINFWLPRLHSSSGNALKHCSCVLEKLMATQAPVAFKIGFTHNPDWRWGNKLYGYRHCKKMKWSTMILMYVANEPFGPSMLEAALIDKFESISPAFSSFHGALQFLIANGPLTFATYPSGPSNPNERIINWGPGVPGFPESILPHPTCWYFKLAWST